MKLIDSHVNLHHADFADDQAEVIARARAAGIGLMVTISDKLAHALQILPIAEGHDDIFATIGTHPHEAKDNPDITPEDLLPFADHPKVVAFGETGLDYHYGFSPRDIQIANFKAHIAASQRSGLPLVVHTREADEDCEQILQTAYAEAPFKILMHCYTSGQRLADVAAELGAWFSVSGIATFKNAQAVRDVIATMPEDRIILETDCPYLAPVPMRGKRNEPSFLPHVAAKLAEIRGWSLEETAQRTNTACLRLFDKITVPDALRTELMGTTA